MRLAAGGILHETHTFSNQPATVETFIAPGRGGRGDQILEFAGTNTSIGGVIDACRADGIDLVPTLVTGTHPSGVASRATFESLLDELVERIQSALPVEGVVLTLHGAMVAEGFPDAENEILRRVRAVVGPAMPIAITLDLHANIGEELVAGASIIVGYDTYPHIDINERAQEAVRLLASTIDGRINPTMAIVKPPLLPVPQAMFTARNPMKRLFDRAFELEERGDALSITIAGGFPYADVPMAGMSFLAITSNDPEGAQRIARELASTAWQHRAEFAVHNVAPHEAVAQAIAHPEGPVVLVDVGDNIGGGTPGDSTFVLRELLDQQARNATIVIADAEAAREAFRAGVGGELITEVGGKTDGLHGEPVPIQGTVRLLCDGKWVHEGPEFAGLPADMGPTAVVKVDGINLVLSSEKCMPGDLQQLKSVGIDPERQKIIVVKAAVRWRGGYEPITRHSIDVDTPGLGSIDLSYFDFQHLRRPIYPLDPHTTWQD